MRLTVKEFDHMLASGHLKIRGQRRGVAKKKSGRMSSRKVEMDGHVFDSVKEADIYYEFKLDPGIRIIKLQPRFALLSPFKRENKTYRGITYKADFKIRKNGVLWIVEVKSKGTLKANSKSWPMRRKLFLNIIPKYKFWEIIFDNGKREDKFY